MSIPATEVELELTFDATLAECPVWDDEHQLLYWVDIEGGKVYRYNPATSKNEAFDIGEHVGSIALRKQGGLVMALKTGFAFYELEKQTLTHIADPESHLPNHRFNDGKCDPNGRFWAGTLSYDQQEGVGSLYCLNSNLSVDTKLRRLTIPNGMAWNDAGDTFYFIDSPDRTIYSFDFDQKTGTLQNRTEIFRLNDRKGLPDGMTIDREGKLWVAIYDGFGVIRVDPETGDILHQIELPVPQVTSCTFGGPEFDELYITSAREHMTDEDVEKHPLSGSIFRARVPSAGTPVNRFSG
ncbi:MAG: SMP-30/gluconolactonase/LRE family protein [Balneolaceae bacterium]|nr:SMP-30/gluconolactonase/LRE family protein [Balneolaceae bacterium]